MCRYAADLEWQLLAERAVDRRGEGPAVRRLGQEDGEARPPVVIHRTWRVEPEHFRTVVHTAGAIAQAGESSLEHWTHAHLVDRAAQLKPRNEAA
jgi:hypothetical protein